MTGVNQKNILKELKVDLILLYASKKDTYHLIFCFSDLIQRCSGDFYEPQGLGNVSFKFIEMHACLHLISKNKSPKKKYISRFTYCIAAYPWFQIRL